MKVRIKRQIAPVVTSPENKSKPAINLYKSYRVKLRDLERHEKLMLYSSESVLLFIKNTKRQLNHMQARNKKA
jgi:uncharacterized linocin/CFP29 family protein